VKLLIEIGDIRGRTPELISDLVREGVEDIWDTHLSVYGDIHPIVSIEVVE
jgi:hypothetical protein